MFFSDTAINNIAKDKLAHHLEKYGRNVIFAYGIVDKNDLTQTVVISNLDKWYGSYTAKKLQDVDPVVHIALQRNADFFWSHEKLADRGYTLPEFYNEAAQYGIKCGRTFLIHDYVGNMATLTIMSVTDPECLDIKLVNDRAELQFLLTETHTLLLSIYAAIYRRENSAYNSRTLTNREREVLYLVSMGNEYNEIAERLNIKESTVRYHMVKINERLGAKNSRHAVRIAMASNMIDFI